MMLINLIEVLKNSDEERILSLLDEEINLSSQDQEGNSLLMWASILGQEKVVQKLLVTNAPINQNNFYGDTALILALHHGQLEIAKALIKAGADVNKANFNGYTPLMFATQCDDEHLVNMLLKQGADVNKKAEEDITALMIAAHCGNLNIVQSLIQAGGDLRIQDQTGETAFTWAISAKQYEVSDFIKKTVTDEFFAKEFFFALSRNKIEDVKGYLKQGFDPNYQNKEGWTMLMYAVCYGLEKIIESLLKFGADVSLKSLNNFDALMLAKNNWTKHLLQKSLQTALEKQQNLKKIGIHPVRSQVNLTNSQKING